MTRQDEFVRGLLEQEPELAEDEVEIFLRWVAVNGPDEWHRWAMSWNWDHGCEILEWIVAQPNCDRGTALGLYYLTQPDFFSQFSSVEEIDFSFYESVPLMLKVCEMWRDGAYQTYAYHPGEAAVRYLNQGKEAMLALAAAVPWDVPEGLAMAGIEGERNEFEMGFDGIPVEMLRAVGEDC